MSWTRKQYDERVKELYRLGKVRLELILRAKRNIVWTAAPIQKWSKDEIINSILEVEFPEGEENATTAEA